MIDYNSRVKDLYSTPIGHDIIARILLAMGKDEKIVNNIFVSNMKLSTLKRLSSRFIGESFFDTFLTLVNSEKDVVISKNDEITPKWWKEAVFYQIYPRTFCDSNGDGIGDLQGIILKLDYIKALGVDALWLSPIYDSPNDDNGYDIRDYYKIMSEFGTMEDFDELLKAAHERNIRIIMDLVVNHTSDEHEWFQRALNEPDSKYRNYYYMFEGQKVRDFVAKRNPGVSDIEKCPPNNWTSFFSGSAWNYYEEQDVWALHLFSKKQMDLNWENEDLRHDVYDMINFWLEKGVDGFRMDVMNYISKNYLEDDGLSHNSTKEPHLLPMGDEGVGSMMGFTGIEHYFYGHNLHNFLRETKNMTFSLHDAFSVGEAPGLGLEMGKLITAEERNELDMIFSFDHLENPGCVRLQDYEYDLNYYRDYISDWTMNYGTNCWMSLFYNNHDNPRMVSKISKNTEHALAIERLLAVMQLTLRGTPFIYQGDEMGLLNYDFTSMDQLTDVEAKGYYEEHLAAGESEEEIFKTLLAGTREHARVLLPWGGVSDPNTPSYHRGLVPHVNLQMQQVFTELIAFRREHKDTIVYGDFKVLNNSRDRFVYERTSRTESIIVDANLGLEVRACHKNTDGYTTVFDYGSRDGDLLAYGVKILCKKL